MTTEIWRKQSKLVFHKQLHFFAVDILRKMCDDDCRIKSAFQWKCGRILSEMCWETCRRALPDDCWHFGCFLDASRCFLLYDRPGVCTCYIFDGEIREHIKCETIIMCRTESSFAALLIVRFGLWVVVGLGSVLVLCFFCIFSLSDVC